MNLNFTSAEILFRVIQASTGLERDKAEELVYCLLDWMDSDSFFGHAQYGAEGPYYENLREPYTAKNAPYELMEEMLLVKGMTPQIFEKLRPFVTVYGDGQVNLNTAPAEVLSALGFSVPMVGAILKYRRGPDGVDGNGDDGYFSNINTVLSDINKVSESPVDATQEAVLNGLLAASRVGISSSFFSVHSHGVYEKNGSSMDIDAVIDRGGNLRYCRASEVRANGRG